jgi:hypothetical protein
MEWITIADWPGGKVEVFDEEHEKHGNPEGLIARYVGGSGNALRVLAVWESQEAAQRFFSTMPETAAARLAPDTNGVPTVSAFSADRAYVRELA